jgi:hypothetical protein
VNEETKYELSTHAARRVTERRIELQWIEKTLAEPDQDIPDDLDPSVRHALKRIDETGSRVLRVVYNAHVQPVRVIPVHFDRRMRGKL